MKLKEAEKELEELGLVIGIITAKDEYEDESEEVVLKQFPEASTKVHEGTAIDLDVEVQN